MGWTVLPHPAHSPDLAPSDYCLFGPVKDALHGCHFADDNEEKQSFCDVLQSKDSDFTTLVVYSVLLNTGKSVVKMTETLWKNNLITAKDVRIINLNFIVTAVTFSEKKTGGITFILPLIHTLIISTHGQKYKQCMKKPGKAK
jgi:hypothetical protein